MTQLDRLKTLNAYLLDEAPQFRAQAAQFGADEPAQFRLFRSLVNLRAPGAADAEFLRAQDEYLRAAILDKGVTDAQALAPLTDGICLWRGDITTLNCDAIVNAANSALLGCFYPCHGCIDNAIHTYAGIQLRLACAEIMRAQGHEEAPGRAKLTPAFNLPSKYVLHTVGPIVAGRPTADDARLLASCYRVCLERAQQSGCASVAFCCISTGEFHFPNRAAAEIAVATVRDFLPHSGMRVIFNVFKENDYDIYARLLGAT